MTHSEKVLEFLNKAQVYYLATVEGDKPKCRPIGFAMEADGKIYFGVGTHKNVYRQLQANPNVEICACTGEKFLRYYGKAVFDTNPALMEKACEIMPLIREMYTEQNGRKLGMFHLTDATADFCNISGAVEESIKV